MKACGELLLICFIWVIYLYYFLTNIYEDTTDMFPTFIQSVFRIVVAIRNSHKNRIRCDRHNSTKSLSLTIPPTINFTNKVRMVDILIRSKTKILPSIFMPRML